MALESSKIKIKFERLLFSKCFWNGHLRGATNKNANSSGAHWRTLVKFISNLNFTTYVFAIDKLTFATLINLKKKLRACSCLNEQYLPGHWIYFVKIPKLCTMTLWIYADVEFGAQWGQQISELQHCWYIEPRNREKSLN